MAKATLTAEEKAAKAAEAAKAKAEKAAQKAAEKATKAAAKAKEQVVGVTLEPSSEVVSGPVGSLGILGNQHVIEKSKKSVNGVEYNEVVLANGVTMLLSDRDLEMQLKKNT